MASVDRACECKSLDDLGIQSLEVSREKIVRAWMPERDRPAKPGIELAILLVPGSSRRTQSWAPLIGTRLAHNVARVAETRD